MMGEHATWQAHWTVKKYRGNDTSIAPYDVVELPGNLLTFGGVSIIWEALIGNGPTFFDNANAYLGVGDSTTPATQTQTDLLASVNKVRVAMDATFPTHTDSTSAAAAATVTFQSTFDTSTGNFTWNEVAAFNAAASGRMLNRRVQTLGTKTSADTWVLVLTVTIS